MQKKSRHPVARIRATMAGADLFFPRKSAWRKRRKVKKFLKRTLSDFITIAMLHFSDSAGAVGVRGKLLKKKYYLVNWKLEDKEIVLHEFAHFFNAGKNHLLTANAVNGYFFKMSGYPPIPPKEYPVEKRISDMEFYVKAGKRYEQERFEHDYESDLGYLGTGLSDVGKHFGAFAASKEMEWKKPASGLFLIREVCNGTPVQKAMAEIESGKFDAEIKAFSKRHFKNLMAKKA